MLQEIWRQMLCRWWEEGGGEKSLHIKTRQRHTAQRDLNIYTGEGEKKCNLFLITQPHINPMQRRSKLSLIAPFPFNTELWCEWETGCLRWRIHQRDLLLPAQNRLLSDGDENASERETDQRSDAETPPPAPKLGREEHGESASHDKS